MLNLEIHHLYSIIC